MSPSNLSPRFQKVLLSLSGHNFANIKGHKLFIIFLYGKTVMEENIRKYLVVSFEFYRRKQGGRTILDISCNYLFEEIEA